MSISLKAHSITSYVRAVAERLSATFPVEVVVLPAIALPDSAFYRPRGRYRGERLLDTLAAETPPRFAKVVGLTSRDISVTKGEVYDWGVLGVALLSKRPALVSTYRLGRNGVSRALLLERLGRVATHELGHA